MAEHCFFCGHAIGEDGCERCGTIRSARDERRVRAPCPRCGTEARLVPFGLGEAALQACPRCKGLFVSAVDWDTLFDAFAQEPLPEIVVPDAEEALAYGPYRSPPTSRIAQIDLAATVRCPTCGDEMERLEFAALSRVIIDVCPVHGVWLDAGELERAIDTMHPRPVDTRPVVLKVPPPYPPSPVAAGDSNPPDARAAAPQDASFVPPAQPWERPSPMTPSATFEEEPRDVPWTERLGRALRELMGALTSFRRSR